MKPVRLSTRIDISPELKKRMDAEIREALFSPEGRAHLQSIADHYDQQIINNIRKQLIEDQRTDQQTRTRRPREGDNDP